MIELDFDGTLVGKFRSPQKGEHLNMDGGKNFIVRARINRTLGNDWRGRLYWYGESKSNPVVTYAETGSRSLIIDEPDDLDNKFVIVEWDMSVIPEWKESIIYQIRIDFEKSGAAATYLVDWVEIGGKVPSKYEDGILSFPLRTNESTKRLKGTWAKIKYRVKTTDKFNIFAILAKYRETY
tara:strand:- start:2480 stop:3022 length:543 start_codon:yes stop_codon:yes gene_type:complete